MWKGLFPELGQKYSPQTPVDFKCGFGKEFLKKGNLKSTGISHIRFNEGNKIDLDLHFGCTLDVHEVSGGSESVEELLQLFAMFTSMPGDDYDTFSQFFVSLNGQAQMDFDKSNMGFNTPFASLIPHDTPMTEMWKGAPFIVGNVIDFQPKITELNIYHNGDEDKKTTNFILDKFEHVTDTLNDPTLKMLFEFFSTGFPLVPYPMVEKCLGLKSKDSIMQIKEGYVVLGYDYNVEESDADCLFHLTETIEEKELRFAKEGIKRMDADKPHTINIERELLKLQERAKNSIMKQMRDIKKLEMPDINNLMKSGDIFEGFKKENRDKVFDFAKKGMDTLRVDQNEGIGKAAKDAMDQIEKVMDIGDSIAQGFKAFA